MHQQKRRTVKIKPLPTTLTLALHLGLYLLARNVAPQDAVAPKPKPLYLVQLSDGDRPASRNQKSPRETASPKQAPHTIPRPQPERIGPLPGPAIPPAPGHPRLSEEKGLDSPRSAAAGLPDRKRPIRKRFLLSANPENVTHTTIANSPAAFPAPFSQNISPRKKNRKAFPRDTSRLLQDYKEQLLARILAAKQYPRQAKKRGLTGTAVLSFNLARDGRIQQVKVVQSSRFHILDRAAIDTVRRAGPFSPLPTDLKQDTIWLRLSISYNLE